MMDYLGSADWERLSIFINLLIPKLPSPREDDLSQGILDFIYIHRMEQGLIKAGLEHIRHNKNAVRV